jgi:hypothetical protein
MNKEEIGISVEMLTKQMKLSEAIGASLHYVFDHPSDEDLAYEIHINIRPKREDE